MRIAFVTTSWPRSPGDAAGHFVRAEALAARALGHDVVVLAPDAPHEPGLDVPTLRGQSAFGWPGALERMRRNPLRVLAASAWVAAVRRTIAACGPFDRLVAHWALPSAWPVFDPRCGAALEVVSHGSDVRLLERLPGPARAWLVATISARASEWRFVSPSLRDALVLAAPASAARLRQIARVAPSPFELPDVRGAANERRIEVGRPFVSSVGRLLAFKHVDRIVETAARERVPLIVVGDGPERQALERLAKTTRADARFVGQLPRTEALAWMRASDALWFASVREGRPTVVREAQALDVPVRFL